jgi:Quinolinate phosphoribosyl transferase, N-terminal domain.
MEVFGRENAILCGIDEVKNLLAHALGSSDPGEIVVEALDDGDAIEPKEIVLRITARYRPSACTRPRSWACSPSRPAGPPPRGNASRPPRRSR